MQFRFQARRRDVGVTSEMCAVRRHSVGDRPPRYQNMCHWSASWCGNVGQFSSLRMDQPGTKVITRLRRLRRPPFLNRLELPTFRCSCRFYCCIHGVDIPLVMGLRSFEIDLGNIRHGGTNIVQIRSSRGSRIVGEPIEASVAQCRDARN